VNVASWVSAALALFASFAFAGCVGGGDGQAKSGGPDVEAAFDEDTGGIRGQVVSDEEIPIAGAEVGIAALNLVSSTDANGLFALSHVPPGPQVVEVSALGYNPSGRTIDVQAGAAVDLAFELTPLPSDAPYHRTFIYRAQLSGVMWKLTPTCIYTDVNPLVKTCGGVRAGEAGFGGTTITAGCDVCETHTLNEEHKDFTADWQTIQGELMWQPQSGATGKGFLLDINAPNITRGTSGSINQADPYTWHKSANKGPIAIRVDKDMLAARGVKEKDWNNPASNESCMANLDNDPELEERNNCDWFFRIFPAAFDAGIGEEGFGPDYGIMLENVATMYFSYWVREKAPDQWTALPP